MSEDNLDERIISVVSLVSGNPASDDYLKGLVRLSWGDQSGALTPEEAEKHALRMLAVAAGARQDESLLRFLVREQGRTLEEGVLMLRAFREARG